jgi:hypothetical protein
MTAAPSLSAPQFACHRSVWHTKAVTSGLIIIGRRVGS